MSEQVTVSKEEIKDYIKTHNIPDFHKEQDTVESYAKLEVEKQKRAISIKKLKEVLNKWLYLTDEKYIDLILAAYLSHTSNNRPLWTFIKGNSGCGKSTILEALDNMYGVRRLDNITPNTLASGKMDKKGKGVKDLGEELQGKDSVLLFPDFACLKTQNADSKKAIFGQFRTLYDGKIQKDTGNGISKFYKGCHVTMIAGTTPDIEREFSLANQLGTRELTYGVYFPKSAIRKALVKASGNMGHMGEMEDEIRNIITLYLRQRRYNPEIKVPEGINEFCMDKAEELAIMRANATFERGTGELSTVATPELPMRAYMQFILIYKSLKSLESDYRTRDFKRIIENITQNSGNSIRHALYHFLKKNVGVKYSQHSLSQQLGIGDKTVKRESAVLVSVGLVKREIDHAEYQPTYQIWVEA